MFDVCVCDIHRKYSVMQALFQSEWSILISSLLSPEIQCVHAAVRPFALSVLNTPPHVTLLHFLGIFLSILFLLPFFQAAELDSSKASEYTKGAKQCSAALEKLKNPPPAPPQQHTHGTSSSPRSSHLAGPSPLGSQPANVLLCRLILRCAVCASFLSPCCLSGCLLIFFLASHLIFAHT